jgi:hypothetical protein
MFERLGGRKMVAATLTVATGIGIALYKGDVPQNLLHLLEVVFGVFASTNVINTVGSLSLEKVKVKAETSEPSLEQAVAVMPQQGVPVEDAVIAFKELATKLDMSSAELKELLETIIKSTQLTQNALSMIAEKVLSK